MNAINHVARRPGADADRGRSNCAFIQNLECPTELPTLTPRERLNGDGIRIVL